MKNNSRFALASFISGCCGALLLLTGAAGQVGAVTVSASDDLIFIHHSSGENWLADGLNAALTAKEYIDERNDITYGTDLTPDAGRPDSLGTVPGDRTNMDHWIRWFNDYLCGVKTQGCANGVNRIVMFKSCFPISNIAADGTEPGDPFSTAQTLANYKAVYRHPDGAGNTYSNGGYQYKALEEIFAANPDTLFIAVTAPPLYFSSTSDANAHRARVFNNWLKNDWLAGYNAAHPGFNNVAVFDWFDALANADTAATDPNRLKDSYVGSAGDSHPNAAANTASTLLFCTNADNFLDRVWRPFVSSTTAGITARSPHTMTLSFGTAVSRTYRIEVSTDMAGWLTRADGLTASPCTIDELYPSTTYFFRIIERTAGVVTGTTTVSGVTTALSSSLITPAAGGTQTASESFTGGTLQTSVTLAAGTLSRDVYIRIMTDPVTTPDRADPDKITAANGRIAGGSDLLDETITEVTMYDFSGSPVADTFNAAVILTIPYRDSDQDGFIDGVSPAVSERTLVACTLNETTGEWEPVSGTLNTVANTFTIPLTHFSVYALAGETAAAATLKQVIAYPVPYVPSSGSSGITFANLPENAHLTIYTIAGEPVYEREKRDAGNFISWDARNSAGNNVASGVYLYVIRNLDTAGDTAKGKIVVIR